MTMIPSAVLWFACAMLPTTPGPLPPAEAGWCLGDDYAPQEGDLVFFTYHKLLWHLLFRIGHTGPPFHVGIIVRLPDGRLNLLEAGSLAPDRVSLVEIKPRLIRYPGDVWFRRLHQPLTAEQSQCLT